ncbi:MAG: SMI1/KNR4 family protein [Caulobacteraceae bacterium]
MRQPKNGGPQSAQWSIALGEEIISEFELKRRAEGRLWAEGYTQSELDVAQEKWDLPFPPDLVAFYRDRRPVLGYDWRSDDNEIREILRWPLEGLLFDVEQGGLWWPEWGARPRGAGDRAEVLAKVVFAAPKLIPLVSHRYLPATPREAGNPVFSVYQSDVIYYGTDIADYFDREFVHPSKRMGEVTKYIPFWSDMVYRNH